MYNEVHVGENNPYHSNVMAYAWLCLYNIQTFKVLVYRIKLCRYFSLPIDTAVFKSTPNLNCQDNFVQVVLEEPYDTIIFN